MRGQCANRAWLEELRSGLWILDLRWSLPRGSPFSSFFLLSTVSLRQTNSLNWATGFRVTISSKGDKDGIWLKTYKSSLIIDLYVKQQHTVIDQQEQHYQFLNFINQSNQMS
ncbi:hypothetical protein OIU85_010103 [Salix viminalis]|uniref:Uncharacterized protein n=1 Tax=Salix viminalis TaxID=40686 RepID=A0A9Q0SH64_SALVM|nr:hypothetical protein OIU85_010103 [Salix viminalis]